MIKTVTISALLVTALVSAIAVTPVLADQTADRADPQRGMKTETRDDVAGAARGSNTTQTFDDLDRNQDGKLDENELNTWGSTAAGNSTSVQEDQDRGERLLQRYDRNGDNAISKDEMDQAPMSDTAQ